MGFMSTNTNSIVKATFKAELYFNTDRYLYRDVNQWYNIVELCENSVGITIFSELIIKYNIEIKQITFDERFESSIFGLILLQIRRAKINPKEVLKKYQT